MSIQVLDDGLAIPPVYDVPQYPEQGFDCRTLRQLVEIVKATGMIPDRIGREYYVDGILFSIALFNQYNEEIASLSLPMHRGQFHCGVDGRGRKWGEHVFKATQKVNVGYLLDS